MASQEKTQSAIQSRRENYNREKKEKVLGSDKNNFFKCVNSFLKDSEVWDVRSLFPEDDEKAAAEKIADFFNAISNEYQPMDMSMIPVTFSAPVPLVDESAVITLLKDSKKPNSRVPGDMFPDSVKRNYKELARPVADIINSVLQTCLLYTSPSPRD